MVFNVASTEGRESALKLRDWLVESDSHLDPQAYILRPDVILTISKEFLKAEGHYRRAKVAALKTLEVVKVAARNGDVKIDEREGGWLDNMLKEAESLPDSEEELWGIVKNRVDMTKFVAEDYDLA